MFFKVSPSPPEGEGWDEGGILVEKHPSPYPLPQGARVYFYCYAKYIDPNIFPKQCNYLLIQEETYSSRFPC
jgi:hypothetical protein